MINSAVSCSHRMCMKSLRGEGVVTRGAERATILTAIDSCFDVVMPHQCVIAKNMAHELQ